jgi:hypothetical protein
MSEEYVISKWVGGAEMWEDQPQTFSTQEEAIAKYKELKIPNSYVVDSNTGEMIFPDLNSQDTTFEDEAARFDNLQIFQEVNGEQSTEDNYH